MPASNSRAGSLRYLAAVLLLPAIVLWRQDNPLFTGFSYLDPWYYFGFFRDLVDFKRNLYPATYYGSRLPWILPGAAVQGLFSPLLANDVLHLGVHTVATVSLFLTLRWVAGARPAFLAAMVFSVNPWLWSATGWDNPDGAGVAYCLLAMALLTWAAVRPGRPWVLLAAGMALACLVYTNIFWVTLAWLPVVCHLALTRAWRRTPLVRSAMALGAWLALGGAIVTVVLGAINWYLDGHFFFYAPSVLMALQLRGTLHTSNGPWTNGALSPWLLLPVVAAGVSAVILATRWRKWTYPDNTAPVLFSAQFLCAFAWLAYREVSGDHLLSIYYYTSTLLPFSFLAMGVWFWPALGSLSTRTWGLICAAAAAVFGLVWLDGTAGFLGALPHATLVGCAALAAASLLRRRVAGVVLSIAGFALLMAPGVSLRYAGLERHAYRRQYESIVDARSHLEAARHGAAVRFWYDPADRAAPDAQALISSYLSPVWSHSETTFTPGPGPHAWCDAELMPSTLVAGMSTDGARAAVAAASAVSACWGTAGLRVAPVETGDFDRGSYRYTMALLRVETAPGAWIPVAPVFDSNRHAVLQDGHDSRATEFPPQYWVVAPGGDSRAYLRAVPGGVEVRTHAAPGSLAALYPAIRAQAGGRYRFAMPYRRYAGAIHFGAFRSGTWLASATRPSWDGSEPELVFWVDLAAGEEFQLAMDNNNGAVALPASFVMKGVTAVRVKTPAPLPPPAPDRSHPGH
jgi:hypothetical protein